ncbi:hypothetical protein C1H46_030778 [Malus baccata]|uniref:Water stress and hypersensitive response domain-containing protein n=1 Tax=Malus baccata TaxID=106549 RepID=A0A540LB05_MALBA|nr:hypothetical protein C1H46_030778 [Malus baccata]
MASYSSDGKPENVDRGAKVKKDHKEEEGEDEGGFVDKVKDFIHDIGEKIEGTIGFGKPTADVTAIHIPSINLEKAEIVVDVLIKNPNPPGSIIPYRVKVDLIVDVPVIGRITIPLEKTGEIPIPYKPDVDVEKIRFQTFSFEETVAVLHLKLENMNDFDLDLNVLDYEIWLCDVSIGGAELSKSANLAKKGVTYVDVPITFRPKDFGSALWDMIREKGTGYTIKGNINVDTPFGAMKLPIVKEGGTTRLKKNKEDGDDDDEE